MKLLYEVPAIEVCAAEASYILTASNVNKEDQERYNYLCPYMPDRRCRNYNRFVRKKYGGTSLPSNVPEHLRYYIKGTTPCPWKEECAEYKKYCELTQNGKQR